MTVALSEDLVADLREALRSRKGNYGHRVLCGLAATEIERLRVVFDEACNEVKVSHGKPCFCKYCHEETPK